MTDKQIIIDGVDVSGCKYFANNKCLMLCATGTACDVYPYCYYKAYKAKEQECEELKKKCNIYTCGICGNKEDCNKLYRTLTEIKEIAEAHKKDESVWNPYRQLDLILQKISEVEE